MHVQFVILFCLPLLRIAERVPSSPGEDSFVILSSTLNVKWGTYDKVAHLIARLVSYATLATYARLDW